MDNSVGRIVAALGEKGGALRNNTLVIFTSDNGPWNIKETGLFGVLEEFGMCGCLGQ